MSDRNMITLLAKNWEVLRDQNEVLQAENEKLKKQVASLAAQLDSLLDRQSKAARRQYDDERDYLPYHEYEER